MSAQRRVVNGTELGFTPLDLAQQTATRLWPGHDWLWYRLAVQRINRDGATTASEQRVLSVYRNAMERFRLTGGCEA